jgi:pyruvate ferredoxin oxidoreductase alpha subunit
VLKTEKSQLVPMSGSEAVAKAVIQSNVDFASAYPITPQTIIVERLSDLVATGQTKTAFVNVESEHSALSACVGASIAGGRVFTATSSQGLALMHEVLYLTSGLRCPIVMAVANRALSAPINIHGDHSDMMGSRDSGWIQLYAENAQEAYDWCIQAFKIAEDERVSLPFTVNMDGYVITHSVEPIALIDDGAVGAFLPKRQPRFKIDTKKPITFGTLTLPDYYSEFKKQQDEAMRNVPAALNEVTKSFSEMSGRNYESVIPFELQDAKVALVSLGSASGTIRWVARNLRKQGLRVGALKIALYRPFPNEEVASLLENVDVVIVLERALSLGAHCGPLASDVVCSLYDRPGQPRVMDVVAGLGGRDLSPESIEKIFRTGLDAAKGSTGLEMEFVGVRE